MEQSTGALAQRRAIDAAAAFNRWCGIEVVDAGPGSAIIAMPWRPEAGQYSGTLHAGLVGAAGASWHSFERASGHAGARDPVRTSGRGRRPRPSFAPRTKESEGEPHRHPREQSDVRTFFAEAPTIHPDCSLINGVERGVRVEEFEDPLMQKIRYPNTLVDELARGRPMEKILRH